MFSGAWWHDAAARAGQRLPPGGGGGAATHGCRDLARPAGGLPSPPPSVPFREAPRQQRTRALRRGLRCCGGIALAVTCAAAVGGGALSRRPRRRDGGHRFGVFEDPRRRATDVLLVTNGVVYVAQMLSRGAVLSWGAKVNSLIAAGQVWRLVTPALLHGSVVHLLVNSYSLNELGPGVETLLGRNRFVALYAASTVGGNVASFFMSPHPAVGASGAIFGLLGCMGVYLARHQHLHGGVQLQAIQRAVVLNLMFGAASPSVDNWAHLGGLAAGALLTLLFGPNMQWEGRRLVDRPLIRLPPRRRRKG